MIMRTFVAAPGRLARGMSTASPAFRMSATTPSGQQRLTAKPFQLKGTLGYINGKWVPAASGKTIAVINPADGEEVARVPDMGAADTQAAIDAANAAFPAWAAKPAAERAAILRRMFDLMMANQEGLAVLLTAECGKPLEEAKGEVKYAADFLEWYAEEAKRGYGELTPGPPGRRILTIPQPVGPSALLTPWNFSIAMPARKLAPALAAGCTVVIRPSINTPLCAIALAQIAEMAGVPPGVVNVVLGEDHAATAGVLCASNGIKKLSFTGSTRVGKELMAACAPTLKKLSLELGGRAPFIVFEDADVDAAVEGAVASKFRNAGQTCVCANTIFVHDSIYDKYVAALAAKVSALKLGDGMVAGNQVGPVISQRALSGIEGLVRDATSKGARVLAGGARATAVNGGKGWFMTPTVLEGVRADMGVVQEEIFGPIAPVMRFSNEAEVIRLANSSTVGLAAYFYSKDLSRVWRVAEALEVGMVGVNTGLISTAVAPFGGIKQSGFGREGSRHGLNEYTQLKYVMMAV